jgi:hypothetical protein
VTLSRDGDGMLAPVTILRSARAALPAALGLALGLLAAGCFWARQVGVHAHQCYEGALPPLDAPSLEKIGFLRRELARESRLPLAAPWIGTGGVVGGHDGFYARVTERLSGLATEPDEGERTHRPAP